MNIPVLILMAGVPLVLTVRGQAVSAAPAATAAAESGTARDARLDSGAPIAVAETETKAARVFGLESSYSADVFGIVAGGRQRAVVYRGLGEASLHCNLAAAAGLPTGTTLRVSALYPHGGNLSARRVGDLQGASNIEAYNHPLLYETWLGGTFGGDRVSWRAGRLVADGDFATTESGGVFLNSSFGWPAFISGNTRNTGPAFYRSALGVSARFAVARNIQIQAGVYDGDSFDDPDGDPSRHPGSLHLELGGGQGRFSLFEVVVERPGGSPGTLKIGAWHHTGEFADQFDPDRNHAGNHGVYAVAEQLLWRETTVGQGEPQGLTVFARAGFSPGDRSFFAHTWDLGLNYTGLVPGRDADTFGLGMASVRISDAYRRAERAAGVEFPSDYERVVELSYRFVVREYCQLVPNLQWIQHPGGSRTLPDALLLGLRSRFTF